MKRAVVLLACLFALSAAHAEVQPDREKIGNWDYHKMPDKLRDDPGFIASARGSDRTSGLSIGCSNPHSGMVVFFSISRYVGHESKDLDLRVDKRKAASIRVNYIGNAAAIDSQKRISDLLQQVAGGSSIYVRGQGIDNSIFDATIDITGVDEAIKRVTADCNFKP